MTQIVDEQAAGQTILVVDDDLMSLEMLVSILEQEYRVVKAQSGAAALALLEQLRPDLILLDLVMPEMDGYTLFQRIKEQPALADTPVLFLTCMTEEQFEVKGLELGAVDYIAKPYNPHIVRLRIRNHLLLKSRQDQLVAISRSKSEFLANMSHEIRTPMNGVIGMTQLLRLTSLTPEQHQYLEAIELSADNLLDLINDILDLSKVEAGKVELDSADFSVHKAVQDVVTTQISRVHQKGLQLQLELSEALPLVVRGDQLRLKQILLNLLGNAVKFTEQGSITLSADLVAYQDQSSLIRITVADTGIGIDPSMLRIIFQPFSQGDRSITHRFGGTGLGLTICSRLAELMGGTITVASEPGQGSRFSLELPFGLPQAAAAAPTPSEPTQTLAEVPPLTVLVAEDNRINSYMAEQMLRKLGHRPLLCGDGQAAVERWAEGGIDLILMDIQMPVLGGEEALQLIRSAEADQGRHTPVVALTADALHGSKERLLQAGFDGYLTKPFRLAALAEELQRAMAAASTGPA